MLPSLCCLNNRGKFGINRCCVNPHSDRLPPPNQRLKHFETLALISTMASRTPKIEEVNDEFDDDFDLPLPDRPVPLSTNPSVGSSGLSSSRPQHVPGVPHPVQRVADAAPFKS